MSQAIGTQPALETTQEKPTRQRHLLSLILVITVFVAFIDRLNISVLMADKTFLADMKLGGDTVGQGLLMTVFIIVYAIGNIFLGPVGDFMGPRKAMVLSLLGWEVSLVVGGLAPFFAFLILSRVLLGATEAMQWPMQSTFVKNWFPLKERGKANAIWGSGTSIAPAICMPMITAVVYYSGWRASFFVLAAIGVVPLLLLWFFTTDTPQQSKRINRLELAYIESGLSAEMAAEAEMNQNTYRENVKAILTNYRFWLLTGYYAVHSSVYFGVLSWLPAYLKATRGVSWAVMGMWASAPFWLIFFCKLFCGYCCDKTGRRAPFMLITMLGAGLGIYFSIITHDNLTAMIILTLGLGLIGFATPASYTLLQDVVPRRAISTGAGLMNGLANIIAGLSPVTVGYVISITGSYHSGLMYLGSITTIGGVIALILIKVAR
jgi:sugar phosphate permease